MKTFKYYKEILSALFNTDLDFYRRDKQVPIDKYGAIVPDIEGKIPGLEAAIILLTDRIAHLEGKIEGIIEGIIAQRDAEAKVKTVKAGLALDNVNFHIKAQKIEQAANTKKEKKTKPRK